MATSSAQEETYDLPPAVGLHNLLLLALAVVIGVFGAVVVLPAWLPAISASLLGREPKGYWYLSRASGFVAFGLLWLSAALGVAITNKLVRLWPGGPTAVDLHQHTGLLGLTFALFHTLILLGDRYVGYTMAGLLVPFASVGYRPFWVGLGQIAFYLMLVVWLSFYGRRRIGHQRWRRVHYISFLVFLLALAHGISSGTDGASAAARGLYWTSAGSLLFLTVYRLLGVAGNEQSPGVARPEPGKANTTQTFGDKAS